MKNSNLAERLDEFANIVSSIDPSESKLPRILAAVARIETQPLPRPIPARRRIQIRDQGLRAFRVF